MRIFIETKEDYGFEITALDKTHHLARKTRRSLRIGGWLGIDIKTYAKRGSCYSCGNENTQGKWVEDDANDGIEDLFRVCTTAHCDGNLFPEWVKMVDDY
jgi:hypothetical protein